MLRVLSILALVIAAERTPVAAPSALTRANKDTWRTSDVCLSGLACEVPEHTTAEGTGHVTVAALSVVADLC